MSVLAHNNHVTFNGMATALVSSSFAALFTNICCGIFQDFINDYQDLILTMGFLLRAIRTIKENLFFSYYINNIFISL